MPDNFIEDMNKSALRVIADYLYATHESDWMEAAGCLADDYADVQFIRKPTPDEEEHWGQICAICPVFDQCFKWAEKQSATGVFVAGEWRE